MDDDSRHKVDVLDNGWVFDSAKIGQEESEVVSESDGNTALSSVKM